MGATSRCSTRNEFTEPVATIADHHLECEQTRMRPQVVGKEFETLVYRLTTTHITKRRSPATCSPTLLLNLTLST